MVSSFMLAETDDKGTNGKEKCVFYGRMCLCRYSKVVLIRSHCTSVSV